MDGAGWHVLNGQGAAHLISFLERPIGRILCVQMFQELKTNPFIDSACSTYTVTMGCKPSEADNFLNDFDDACELIHRFTAVSGPTATLD